MKNEREKPTIFVQRFLRSYRLLNLIACRVLGDQDRASRAIQNCWRTAFRQRPHFENEGTFRSWLLRILIDEALIILRESRGTAVKAAVVVNAASRSDSTVKRRR